MTEPTINSANQPHWSEALDAMGACSEAVAWARTQPNAHTAWRDCKRGDWMLWIAAQRCEQGDPTHRAIVLAACECARLALQYVPVGEDRPRIAIEAAEQWARGEPGVPLARVRLARLDADADAAAYAAYADAAAYAAAAAADAADAAAYAANAAADAAARTIALTRLAEKAMTVIV